MKWYSDLTEGILGGGGALRHQRFRLALRVDGLDAEHVVLALVEAGHVALGLLGRADGHPAAGFDVHTLHNVAL